MRRVGWKAAYMLLVASTAFVMSGCAFKSEAPMRYFTLDTVVDKPIHLSRRYRQKVLVVAYPESLKEQLGDALVFSYGKGERGRYLNAKWDNTLGRLLEGTMIDIVRKSGLFKAVLPYSSDVSNDYRLETVVYDFCHRLDNGRSYAYITLETALIDMHTGKILKTGHFVYKEPTPTVDAPGYVTAVHRALKRFSRDLILWLDRK